MLPNVFFTGCTHFSHSNVLIHCNRPFANIREHDEALIANWNAVVKPKDLAYFLGDVSFGSRRYTDYILSRLNGLLYLVRGNHDKKAVVQSAYWQWVKPYFELSLKSYGVPHKITLCHYPLLTWNKAHYGAYMLHSHSHGSLNHLNAGVTRLDVGVDSNSYRPWSIDDVVRHMINCNYVPVDHHGKGSE